MTMESPFFSRTEHGLIPLPQHDGPRIQLFTMAQVNSNQPFFFIPDLPKIIHYHPYSRYVMFKHSHQHKHQHKHPLPSGNLLQFAIENGPFESLVYLWEHGNLPVRTQ